MSPSAALACALTQGTLQGAAEAVQAGARQPVGLMINSPSPHPGKPTRGSANYLGSLGAANYGCTGG